MKKILFSFVITASLLACGNKTDQSKSGNDTIDSTVVDKDFQLSLITAEYVDSCDYAVVHIVAQMPTDEDQVSRNIRVGIMQSIDDNYAYSYGTEQRMTKQYPTQDAAIEGADARKIVKYYGQPVFKELLNSSQSDYAERKSMQEEDGDDTYEVSVMQYSKVLNITKTAETEKYYVFSSEGYAYYGGAHGGVIGNGHLTFRKTDGVRVKNFIVPSAVSALQKVIRKGLCQYFSEEGTKITDSELDDCLLLDGKQIPLPAAYSPYPTPEGLMFVYAQYEIAPYAAGMPAFCVPYSVIGKYLTVEAAEILN